MQITLPHLCDPLWWGHSCATTHRFSVPSLCFSCCHNSDRPLVTPVFLGNVEIFPHSSVPGMLPAILPPPLICRCWSPMVIPYNYHYCPTNFCSIEQHLQIPCAPPCMPTEMVGALYLYACPSYCAFGHWCSPGISQTGSWTWASPAPA